MVDPAGSRRKVRTMSKKMMLLAAGALAALAITALPGAASAKETALKCEKVPCTFTEAGGVTTLSTGPSGDTVSCTSVTGEGQAINLVNLETTTLKITLKSHGCKETTTIFKFACTTPGLSAGTILSNTVTGHLVALPGTGSENGILLTDVKTTFTCAGGFARTTVTGNIIGENEAKCGAAAANIQLWNFVVPSHGNQAIKTWTEATWNLIAATNHNTTPTATSGYETAAKAGTTTLTWNQKVTVACAE
jgi:hypothetical protein